MYPELQRKLLGWAFILGPVLAAAAALIWVAGIGVNAGSMAWGSYVEGLIGYFGYILLTPVFLHLATMLGRDRPRLAAVAAVIALIGFAGGGVMNMAMRVLIHDLAVSGVPQTAFDEYTNRMMAGSVLSLALIMTGPLGPISASLLGFGFLRSGRLGWRGWALLASGLIFMTGQLFQQLPEITYVGASVLWAVILVPMGMRMLREKADAPGTHGPTGLPSPAI